MQGVKLSNSIQVLVSTMKGRALERKSFDAPEFLIVDQLSPHVRSVRRGHYISSTVGLSASRNEAIDCATADIVLFADDDVQHIDGFIDVIKHEFERTGADVITFQIETPDGCAFKSYSPIGFRHNLRTLMRVNSIEIAVRRSSLLEKSLRFDEQFGLGARFPTGEEVIFLADALRSGLVLQYCPVPIVIHPKESSGSNLFRNKSLILAKGAMLGRIFRWSAPIVCVVFAVRHYEKSGYSFFGFLGFLLEGLAALLFGRFRR